MELLDLAGDSLVELPAKRIPASPSLYNMTAFQPPDQVSSEFRRSGFPISQEFVCEIRIVKQLKSVFSFRIILKLGITHDDSSLSFYFYAKF